MLSDINSLAWGICEDSNSQHKGALFRHYDPFNRQCASVKLNFASLWQVLYYLMRVEPFTTLSIQLQVGKFDHANIMFLDIHADILISRKSQT